MPSNHLRGVGGALRQPADLEHGRGQRVVAAGRVALLREQQKNNKNTMDIETKNNKNTMDIETKNNKNKNKNSNSNSNSSSSSTSSTSSTSTNTNSVTPSPAPVLHQCYTSTCNAKTVYLLGVDATAKFACIRGGMA